MLRDFLFVDERRINSLFEQISGPNKKEKTGSVKASLSFPKIGVETEIKTESRPYTLTEKIHILEDYFEQDDNKQIYLKFNLLDKSHFEESVYPFDIEYIKFLNFNASKILISDGKNTELIMWMSSDPKVKIYLFEQMRNIDGAPMWWSSYSTFNAITFEFDQSQHDTFFSKLKGEDIEKFDSNPNFYLNKIAKKRSSPRIINCMVKVRTTFMPVTPDGNFDKAVVGYPMYIY